MLAAALAQFIELKRFEAIDASIQAIPARLQQHIDLPASVRKDAPHVQLAYANALSKEGKFEQAESSYTLLIQHTDDPLIANAARYNLANAYLRQGMLSEGTDNQSQTMLALAKQRYRDLLKSTPDDWNARYNLERALYMSPEGDDSDNNNPIEPLKRVRVIVPGFEKQDLP